MGEGAGLACRAKTAEGGETELVFLRSDAEGAVEWSAANACYVEIGLNADGTGKHLAPGTRLVLGIHVRVEERSESCAKGDLLESEGVGRVGGD